MIKVGIIGLGTVGQSVLRTINTNLDLMQARAGEEVQVTKVVVRDLNKKRQFYDTKFSNDVDFVLEDEEIDIILELAGGIDEPLLYTKKALSKKKAVITANKALLAYHRKELCQLSKYATYEYEASVAGGIPVINALREGLSANRIMNIKGILNGTCNFILTKMHNEGLDYKTVLKEAMNLGYAEANPTFDLSGFDASHKLLILSTIAFNMYHKPEDILVEGIKKITQDDIEFAKEFGYSIKLLAIANRRQNQVELRVHPALIPNKQMLAKVDGVMNGISITGDVVGETMYYGAGAGGDATASAVVANVIDVVRKKRGDMFGFYGNLQHHFELVDVNDIQTHYYIRLNIEDKAGILAQACNILSQNNISIKRIIQKPKDNQTANLLFSTHKVSEKNIQKSIHQLQKEPYILANASIIRIEE